VALNPRRAGLPPALRAPILRSSPTAHSVYSNMASSVLAPHKNGLADGSAAKLSATAKVFQAIQGHWLSACLGVLMELRIPEILADGGEMTFSEAYPKTTCVPHCHAAPPALPVYIAAFVGRKSTGVANGFGRGQAPCLRRHSTDAHAHARQ